MQLYFFLTTAQLLPWAALSSSHERLVELCSSASGLPGVQKTFLHQPGLLTFWPPTASYYTAEPDRFPASKDLLVWGKWRWKNTGIRAWSKTCSSQVMSKKWTAFGFGWAVMIWSWSDQCQWHLCLFQKTTIPLYRQHCMSRNLLLVATTDKKKR